MKRTPEQKKLVVTSILEQVNSINLSPQFLPIKELYKLLQEYQQNDYSVNININFPEIGKKIVGVLPINVKNKPIVKIVSSK